MSNLYRKIDNQHKLLITDFKLQESMERFTPEADFHSCGDSADQLAYQMLLNRFSALVDPLRVSKNPLNDYNLYKEFPILDSGFDKYEGIALCINGLHPDRMYMGDNSALIRKYELIMQLIGYNKSNPIVFDKHWKILDGYQRLHACRITETRFHWVKIDYQSNEPEE